MPDWPTIVLLTAVAALLLAASVLVGRFLLWPIGSAWLASKRALAAQTSVTLPGLGQFSSADGDHWCGIVQGLQITIATWSETPTHTDVEQIQAILYELPALAGAARTHLAATQDLSWLDQGSSALEPFGISLQSGSSFRLEFTHAGDLDGLYWTEFGDGKPVRSGRDD